MITYYLITTGLSLINLLVLIFTFENKKINYYFMMLMLIMAISNGGYLDVMKNATDDADDIHQYVPPSAG